MVLRDTAVIDISENAIKERELTDLLLDHGFKKTDDESDFLKALFETDDLSPYYAAKNHPNPPPLNKLQAFDFYRGFPITEDFEFLVRYGDLLHEGIIPCTSINDIRQTLGNIAQEYSEALVDIYFFNDANHYYGKIESISEYVDKA